MIVSLFEPSIVFAVLIIVGFFLIISLCIAAWASGLFYLIGKIPQKRLQMILPVAVALVFIAGDIPFTIFVSSVLGENEFFRTGPYTFILSLIPFATIIAMGIIMPFPIIREHLTLKRAWYAIFAATTIAATYIYLYLFIQISGQNAEIPLNFIGGYYVQVLTAFCQILDAMVIAAAVFGAILFLQYVNELLAGHHHKRGILAVIAGALLILLPSAGIGGLVVFLWLVLRKIPGKLFPIGVSVIAVFMLALFGSMLAGIPGIGIVVDTAIITMFIMALAMLVPFLYLAPSIEGKWQVVILLTGAVAADIVLSVMGIVFGLGERLTADPITMVTFAEGGIIFAACAYAAGQYLVTHRTHLSPLTGEREAP